jgi:hypothetical protein
MPLLNSKHDNQIQWVILFSKTGFKRWFERFPVYKNKSGSGMTNLINNH